MGHMYNMIHDKEGRPTLILRVHTGLDLFIYNYY